MSVSKFGEEGRVWYLQTHCEPRCLGHECPEASSKSLPLSQLWGDRVRGGCMLGSYLEIPCGRGNCRGTEGICSVIFSEPAEVTVIWLPQPWPRFDWGSCIDGSRVVSLYLSKCFWEEELWSHLLFYLQVSLIIHEFANQNVRGSEEMTNKM